MGHTAPAPTAGTDATTAATSSTAMPRPAGRDEELAKLPIDLLQRGKYQPRIDMRQDTLQELADSIKMQGIIQPIVVRPVTTAPGQPQRYEIIAGERRWRAAQLAGLHEIPTVIRRVDDNAAVAMALIENIQRENLNPLEEARALDRLIKEFALTQAAAAEAVGRSRTAVTNLLRLLELADEVKARVEKGELEMGHARALLGLASPRKQAQAAAEIVAKGLSVRATEALVKRMQEELDHPAAPVKVDPNIKNLENELTEKLGAKVQLQHAATGKGRLVINYHSLDELDGVLERLRH